MSRMKTSVVVADEGFSGVTAPLIGPYQETVKRAAEIGFDAIQLTVNRPSEVPLAELKQVIKHYGLEVSSIATGLGYAIDGLSMGSADEENRRAAVRRMKEHVDLAADLGGADVIIGTIRGRMAESGGWAIYEEKFSRSIEELLPYAEKHGATVLLEANDHLETDVFLSLKETCEFLRKFNSPRFKLQIDSMHMLYENQDIYPEIIRAAPLIAQVDISDENRMAPDGKHFDFPLMMKALRDIDYERYLVFEYRLSPPEDAVLVGFRYMKNLRDTSGNSYF